MTDLRWAAGRGVLLTDSGCAAERGVLINGDDAAERGVLATDSRG